MFAAFFISAALLVALVYFLFDKRLRAMQIAFVWIVVVFLDEFFFTLMLLNWNLYQVSERTDELFLRLLNLNLVTPVIVLFGIEWGISVRRVAVRMLAGIVTATKLFGVNWVLIRSQVIRTSPDFHWPILYAEELLLVVGGYIAWQFISMLMRKDGIAYDPYP